MTRQLMTKAAKSVELAAFVSTINGTSTRKT
jgi:hypothetical protein